MRKIYCDRCGKFDTVYLKADGELYGNLCEDTSLVASHSCSLEHKILELLEDKLDICGKCCDNLILEIKAIKEDSKNENDRSGV
jgi:hypothetical protein